jgi:hypothetical protein
VEAAIFHAVEMFLLNFGNAAGGAVHDTAGAML